MIPEFLWFVFLVSALVGFGFWRIWFRNRSYSPGEAQFMDRDEGGLPDSFFDTRTDPQKDFQK